MKKFIVKTRIDVERIIVCDDENDVHELFIKELAEESSWLSDIETDVQKIKE